MLLCLCKVNSNAQIDLTIENTIYVSTDVNWTGVNIPRSTPTNLIFRNNSITSVNPGAYMLRCGDDLPSGNNNNLDGAIISGNKLLWIGEEGTQSTHGMINGYSINYHTRYNYVDNASFGIVYEGIEGMTYTEGGLYYNVLRKGRTNQVIMNGQNNVAVYNNTFYTSRPNYSASFIKVDLLRQVTPTATSNNIKIKNNIFYSVNNVSMIAVDDSSFHSLECDYNIYWNENSINNEPTFYSIDSLKFWTWGEWRAFGFDEHSLVLNPNFTNNIDLVPLSRLDYGTDLGGAYNKGLAIDAEWGNGYPATELQGDNWQVGAYVYSSTSSIEHDDFLKFKIYPNPNNGYFEVDFNDELADNSYSLSIINISGVKVYEDRLLNRQSIKVFKLPGLSSGIYTMLISHNNRVTSKRFIKR